jgi:cysteine desulfurase
MEPAKWMCQDAPYFEIPVDQFGTIDLGRLEEELATGKYVLVSVQYGNNEIGTVQPVKKVAELCRKHAALFHCDAVQAFGKVVFDVDDIGADMISISAHKIHGPMGVGALYIKSGTVLEPLLHGGGHEDGMRSGTLAVPEIVGFGKAADIACEAILFHMPRISGVVDWLAAQSALMLSAQRNGHPTVRLPHILSITIPGIESEVVCGIMCSKFGMCLSAGSACSTEKRRSHVLEAIGRPEAAVLSTLRISLSRFNTIKDAQMLIGRLQAAKVDSEKRELI